MGNKILACVFCLLAAITCRDSALPDAEQVAGGRSGVTLLAGQWFLVQGGATIPNSYITFYEQDGKGFAYFHGDLWHLDVPIQSMQCAREKCTIRFASKDQDTIVMRRESGALWVEHGIKKIPLLKEGNEFRSGGPANVSPENTQQEGLSSLTGTWRLSDQDHITFLRDLSGYVVVFTQGSLRVPASILDATCNAEKCTLTVSLKQQRFNVRYQQKGKEIVITDDLRIEPGLSLIAGSRYVHD